MSSLNPENKCSNLLSNKTIYPTIEEMFNMQLKLQEFLNSKGKTIDYKNSSNKDRIREISIQWRNLTLEFSELLERLPFKEWKSYSESDFDKAFCGDNYVETLFEYIDMFHFFMNIGLLLGISGEDFSKLYYLKNKENFDRQLRGY